MGKLVNLGSLCIDHVYRVPHLSGAGETVASLSHDVFPGGKGLNQSIAAAYAGAEVIHVGCVGDDGATLISTLAAAGVDITGVRTLAGGVSGHAVIQVNEAGENAIVIAGGANRELQSADIERALAVLGDGDWLLLQNEVNDLPRVLEMARSTAARVAFNLAPVDGREAGYDLSVIDLLIVNQVEAAALVDHPSEAPQQILEQLQLRYPQMTLVLTLGAEGLLYAEPGRSIQEVPAFPVYIVDETAAGDAFIGFLLAGLLAGAELKVALQQGSAAGALAVTRAGAATSIPLRQQVEYLLRQNPAT